MPCRLFVDKAGVGLAFFTMSNSPQEPTLRIPDQLSAGPPFLSFFRFPKGGGAPRRRVSLFFVRAVSAEPASLRTRARPLALRAAF
jgi:hypothetical protein